jgi:hypothetical protein
MTTPISWRNSCRSWPTKRTVPLDDDARTGLEVLEAIACRCREAMVLASSVDHLLGERCTVAGVHTEVRDHR